MGMAAFSLRDALGQPEPPDRTGCRRGYPDVSRRDPSGINHVCKLDTPLRLSI